MGTSTFIKAQTPIPDSIYTDTTPLLLNSYFSFDISYTNNNLTSKNIYASSLGALFTDISFYHKSGVWASVMPVSYPNSIAPSYDINTMAGYQHFFNNGLDINTYYNYHSYTGDSAFMGINYTHSLNLSLGYNVMGFYAFADAYSLWGSSSNYFTDMGLGYYHEFYLGKKQKDYLSVFPLFTLSFGTDYWIYNDLTPRDTWLTKTSLYRNGYNWDTFDMQRIDFMLPIGYTHKNITGSISYIFSVPTNKYKFLGWENQSGVMLSLYYLLNLK